MRIILTSDQSLTSTFRNIPLLDFLPCAPVEKLPKSLYKLLDTQLPDKNGRLLFAPYAIRKVEAALVHSGFKREEIVVAHPKKVEQFIDGKTTIVGINTMDPYGLGPVTLMFTEGGKYTSYSEYMFISLVKRLRDFRKRKRYKFKIVIGSQAGWQFEIKQELTNELEIDHVVWGECEHVIADIFRDIESGSADMLIKIKDFPGMDEIPTIVGPTYKGMIEVMRGCGRGCRFCSPNLRKARFYPMEKIMEEVSINLKAGQNSAWLHSEDIFNYMVEDRRNFHPNKDAVIGLFESVLSKVSFANPTHGTVAGALAAPEILKRVAELDKANIDRWIGIQVGLETASPELIKKVANNKMKPFSADEWPWVVLNGTYAFNKFFWFPAYTTMVGIPGETEEDEVETARLIITMEKKLKEKLGEKAHFTVTPLAFVPMAGLRENDFFNIEEHLTEGRILHIYHAWRHLAHEIKTGLNRVLRNNPNLLIFAPLARFGSKLVVNSLKKWAIRKGIDVDKPLEPIDLKIEEIEV
ncbi:MAG: B12-binding domain-containing radical SAM protein [Thermoplasmata archaeon]|nr:MAG: B12-binding domain-containing radical SAM protein [Thermoplasmata archaeon]